MTLESESLTGLRGIAQATGTKFTFTDDKRALLAKIRATALSKVPVPGAPEPNEMMDDRLRSKTPLRACTQKEIYEALQPLFERGLILTFPAEDQWQLEKLIRHVDTGNIRMPLRSIVHAAKQVLEKAK